MQKEINSDGLLSSIYLPQEVKDDAKVAMIAIKHMVSLLIHTRAFVIPWWTGDETEEWMLEFLLNLDSIIA